MMRGQAPPPKKIFFPRTATDHKAIRIELDEKLERTLIKMRASNADVLFDGHGNYYVAY